MIGRFRYLLGSAALATCLSSGAVAQSPYAQTPYSQPGYVNPFAPLTDVDRLAQQLRIVAANPTDLYALINAANLSLKVGDTDAAAAMFTRADRISPQNPRVKAGMARLMVQAGRPGEALRRFQDAERLGATLADFGPDRALAYDLVGEQQRAQREYRALLRAGSDDEIIRRYALSLGISGLKEPALALLEPLNRRSDRGAWRARAFVLAMTGDRPGAERIAITMMPAGMAQGLAPFFDRLPRLSASERAFAVNFGETRASPTRLADARLVPPLPALSPEANPFPQARAAVQIADEDVNDGKKRKKRRSRQERAEPMRLAARQSYSPPLPPPPAPTAAQLASLTATRLPPPRSAFDGGGRVTVLPPPPEAYRGPAARTAPPPTASSASDEPDFAVAAVSTLAAGNRPAAPLSASPPVTRATTPVPTSIASGRPAAPVGSSLPPAQSTLVPPRVAITNPPASALAATTSAPVSGPALGDFRLSGSTSTPLPSSPPAATIQPQVAPSASALAGPLAPTTSPLASQPAVVPPPAAAVAAITPTTGAPPPPTGARGDDVLAAIVADIAIPPAELSAPIKVPTAAVAASQPAPPPGRTRLLANLDRKAEAEKAKALAARPDPTLPKKDARGRFVDAKGKPLLDDRGRPMGPKAAAAWQVAQNATATADKADPKLPKKDARGRFVDAKGKPLLDERGRPMGPKAAAAWQLAQADTAKGKADPKLPKKDARGRFVDDKGKPLLDARGRPMDAKAAAAWLVADAKKKPEPAKGDPARIWVQVAGGANEESLAREWKRVAGVAAALKGKSGWTTPLRATNRILTGPLKTVSEANALVNQLKKDGISAFVFNSAAGQKVTPLGR